MWYSAFFDEVQDSTTCIQFEKASVWFNIAAIYSQIASQTRLSGPDGKKKASMSFQKAAGILIRIRDSYCHKLKANISKNSELNENNLSAMATLMLAQAAECFYEKATEG